MLNIINFSLHTFDSRKTLMRNNDDIRILNIYENIDNNISFFSKNINFSSDMARYYCLYQISF